MIGLVIAESDFMNRNQSASQQGQSLFQIFAWLAFAFAALAGLIGTADCVSSEKREGTLGLLFLTDLKGYDIILGKLAANSMGVIYGLIASVPILSLPLVMGGITAWQVLETALLLLTVLALSCSVGILVSTYSRNDRKAMVFAVLIMIGLLMLPIFAAMMMAEGRNGAPTFHLLVANLSPFFSLVIVLSWRMQWAGFPSFFLHYHVWMTLVWTWLLIALFLRLSARKAPSSWQQSDDAPRSQEHVLTKKIRIRLWKPPRALLDLNPYQWLALRGESSPKTVLGFVLAMIAIWVVGALEYGRFMLDSDVLVPTIVIVNSFLKIWVIAEASRRFVEDRQINALELILSTPLQAREMVQGQWRALIKLFALPILIATVWEATLLNNVYYRHQQEGTMSIATAFYLPVDCLALGWLGMWLALKFNGRVRVMLTGLLIVLAIPLLADVISKQIVEGLFQGLATQFEPTRVRAIHAMNFAFDIAIAFWCVTKLSRNFAAQAKMTRATVG